MNPSENELAQVSSHISSYCALTQVIHLLQYGSRNPDTVEEQAMRQITLAYLDSLRPKYMDLAVSIYTKDKWIVTKTLEEGDVESIRETESGRTAREISEYIGSLEDTVQGSDSSK